MCRMIFEPCRTASIEANRYIYMQGHGHVSIWWVCVVWLNARGLGRLRILG